MLKKIHMHTTFAAFPQKAFEVQRIGFAKEFGSHLILTTHVLEPVSYAEFYGTAWGASIC